MRFLVACLSATLFVGSIAGANDSTTLVLESEPIAGDVLMEDIVGEYLSAEESKKLMDKWLKESDDGNRAEELGMEFYTGGTQEGIGEDIVNDNWIQITGKVGAKTITCESHQYIQYQVAAENEGWYQDLLQCKLHQ